ncbi:MAG: thiamine-phosphate kinase [Deltaproteobacteria bacterium]|nr:thiamine-phosphate kinase [Deltaproteobacteria bacterium]
MLKEIAIIAGFRRIFNQPAPGVIQGIGDDCAVIRTGGRNWLITTDAQVEGVHFRQETTTPLRLGRKCLAVNLSDIAAMGGRPRYAFLNLGLPRSLPRGFLSSFRRGLRAEADKFSVALVGGDTHLSPGGIALGLTVIGEAGTRIAFRSGARPGDSLYVSGFLGQSAAGLRLLTAAPNRRGALPRSFRRELVEAHQGPRPQVELGQFLVRRGYAGAMIDLSDGLASDLRHLCRASGVGARIDTGRLPLSPAFRAATAWLATPPLEIALRGGEDYQLLFTVPPGLQAKMEAQVRRRREVTLFRIGEITPGKRILLITSGRVQALRYQGFDHFTSGTGEDFPHV